MEGIVCDKFEVINLRYGFYFFLLCMILKVVIFLVVGNNVVWYFEFIFM